MRSTAAGAAHAVALRSSAGLHRAVKVAPHRACIPRPAYPPPAYPPATYPPATYPSSAYPPSGYPPGSAQPVYPQSGYPPQGSISPSQLNTGGMSFEIQPSNAQVYVDGQYIGTVGQ